MTQQTAETISTTVRLSLQEFSIPPVRDCLVIGKESPIGCVAIKKALSLLHGEPFEDLHPQNDIISDILVRVSILKKIPQEKLVQLVEDRVAPFMSKHEVILVGIEAEVFLECQL